MPEYRDRITALCTEAFHSRDVHDLYYELILAAEQLKRACMKSNIGDINTFTSIEACAMDAAVISVAVTRSKS